MRAHSRRDAARVGERGNPSSMALRPHGTLNRAVDTTRDGQQRQNEQPGAQSLHGAAGLSSSQSPHPSFATSWTQAGSDASRSGMVPVATSAKSSTSMRLSVFIPQSFKL